MPKYAIEYDKEVKQQLVNLPGHIKQRIRRTIGELLDDPYPPGARQLIGPAGQPSPIWRIRLDQWRVVYLPDDTILVVELLKVGRKDDSFYRGVRGLGLR